MNRTWTYNHMLSSCALEPLRHHTKTTLYVYVVYQETRSCMFISRLNWEEESEVKCFAVLLGAWLGAIPIPLDWDTPWQVGLLICLEI